MHGIGHSLGLKHSYVTGSIMNSFDNMTSSGREFQLSDDDIRGIQFLYGM